MNKNKPKEKITSPENLAAIKKLMALFTGRYKFQLIFVMVLVLVSSAIQIVSSIFLKLLIDNYITPLIGVENPNFTPLAIFLLQFGVVFLIGAVSTLAYSKIMVNISETILKDLRNQLFSTMQKFPVSYFDSHSHGDIMSHFTNDTKALQQMLTNTLPSLFSSVITIIGVISTMLIQSIPLTLIVFVGIGIMVTTMNVIGGKSSKYFLLQQESLGKENGFIEEMIEGQKVIKVFSHEDKNIEEFVKINDELTENTMLSSRYSIILIPIIFSIGDLQYAFISIGGGLLAINGMFGVTVGTIAAFLQLSRAISGPMNNISQQVNQVVMAIGGSRRIFKMLEEPFEEDNGYITLVRVNVNEDGSMTECEERTGHWAWKDTKNSNAPLVPLRGDIRFYNVSFSYDGEHDVLKDISLYAKPGQKIAFVGETGAGKTTITNLINRFYEITEGKITYDGIDIKNIIKKDLRRSLGMVLQETRLFTGDINYNISYGRQNIDNLQIEKAAKKVQAHNFIKLLDKGYETVISGSNSDLSQGQSQLLSIARAEVYDPPVLILDEATSSIDSRTEMLVQKSMDELMQGRTTFVIAHRLSTVKNADAIIVLSKGKIIERGTHDELINQKGVYYKLYSSGFEENV